MQNSVFLTFFREKLEAKNLNKIYFSALIIDSYSHQATSLGLFNTIPFTCCE